MSSATHVRFLRRLVRPLLVAISGMALAGAAAWAGASLMTMGSSLAPGAGHAGPELYFVKRMQFSPEKTREAALAEGLRMVAARIAVSEENSGKVQVLAQDNDPRFDAVVEKAQLTPEKLAALFDRSRSGKSARLKAKHSTPSTLLMHRQPVLLAYAEPSPRRADAALAALLSQPAENGLATMVDPELDLEEETLPEYGNIPDDAPVPEFRPQEDRQREPAMQTEAPQPPQTQATKDRAPKQQKLAYAKPDAPAVQKGSVGRSLRNLFGGKNQSRNDVAVYDISAARVYMPDGSVLEAHSGIGKMADNPNYAHVRMKGPTPPHTYNLRMREKRFHGVEAIRMLPVDGKNKHGRDGFLTHSYLLRGGRAESHGCVAFKDYDKFLNAFKQGKVRQLIVVPSGGRATLLASNG